MDTRNTEPRLDTVLEKDTAKDFDYEAIEKQWQLVTEALKREVISNPAARQALLECASIPLSETSAYETMIQLADGNERIRNLLDRYSASLEKYIALPPVPGELITPDVTNARRFETGDTHYNGITAEERLLIARRYRYGRDIKILCLQAELIDHPLSAEQVAQETRLPSGVELIMDEPRNPDDAKLLNPAVWESRKQLFDRVYEVTVDGEKFILKEQKTPTHTDHKKGGYKPPRTSKEEFEIAQNLKDFGTLHNNQLEIFWERPIAHVEFPDGYQFALFEYDPTVKDRDPRDILYGDSMKIRWQLLEKILKNEAQFKDEYAEISAAAEQKFIHSPEVAGYNTSTSEAMLLYLTKLAKQQERFQPVKLSFEDFAKVKTTMMFEQVRALLKSVPEGIGYTNEDHEGYAYYLPDTPKVKLGAVGFDFEYMQGKPTESELAQSQQHILQRIQTVTQRLPNLVSADGGFRKMSKIQAAAYFALRQKEQNKLTELIDKTAKKSDTTTSPPLETTI